MLVLIVHFVLVLVLAILLVVLLLTLAVLRVLHAVILVIHLLVVLIFFFLRPTNPLDKSGACNSRSFRFGADGFLLSVKGRGQAVRFGGTWSKTTSSLKNPHHDHSLSC